MPGAHRTSAVEHKAQPHPAATLDRSTSIRSLAQLASLIGAHLTQCWRIGATASRLLFSLGNRRQSRRATPRRFATAAMAVRLLSGCVVTSASASSALHLLTTMGNSRRSMQISAFAHKARALRKALCSSQSGQRTHTESASHQQADAKSDERIFGLFIQTMTNKVRQRADSMATAAAHAQLTTTAADHSPLRFPARCS